MVVMLTQCCCGCTLKTGTIIIGVLNLIGAIANTISGIVFAAGYNPGLTLDPAVADAMNINKGVYIAIAVISAIQVIFSILLIVGAHKGNPLFLMPWMVYATFSACVNIIANIITTVECVNMGENLQAIFTMIIALLFLGFQIYFILVVFSLYRQLKGEDVRRPKNVVLEGHPEEAAALNKPPPSDQETV